MIFHQLFEHESSTFTYLLADEVSREAVIIDSVYETVERDILLIQQLNLHLLFSIETHIHADHITGAAILKKRLNAQTVVSKHTSIHCADIKVGEDDFIKFGHYKLKVLETQGHTDSCLSFYINDMVFTGDLLFIRGTGRTDFQQGNSILMYKNIYQKIFTLPLQTKIYPGHDYKGFTHSTVEMEQKFNPRVGLGKSESDFIKIMNELKLAEPKKIAQAVPANLNCGVF